MRALVFDGQLKHGQLKLRQVPAPRLAPGEALIRPHLVGICSTDLEITRGYKGFHGVLGHEFVGTVVACEARAWIGQRVVGEINVACHACATCRRGDVTHCPQRTAIGILGRDGALAELLALPIANLHRVPDSVPDQAAVFCEPLAAALEILEQTHVRPSERVAVVGDGKLGLLVAQVLRLAGCAITVVGRHPERWTLLRRQAIDAVDTVTPALRQACDLVIECTGRPGGLATARQLVRPRGRLVLKSTFHGALELDLAGWVVDEVTLIGSRCGPFAAALRLLERGLIETEPLIAATMPLEQAEAALAAARGALKILVRVADAPQATCLPDATAS